MKFGLVCAFLVPLADAICNLDHCSDLKLCEESYTCKQLAYDAATGKFTGTLISDSCPRNAIKSLTTAHSYVSQIAVCSTRQLPVVLDTPAAIPFGRPAGILLGGELLYGPLEVAIRCVTDKGGICAAGIDPGSCRDELAFMCPKSYTDVSEMHDSCGFSSVPYHTHIAPAEKCFYDNKTEGHSPIVGIADDGYGIYGMYEKAGKELPSDLDACNGHFGVIEDKEPYPLALVGITDFKIGKAVYHYHTSRKFPFTMGCYGPATYDECTRLTLRDASNAIVVDNNALCGTYAPVQNADGDIYYYDDFCPCGYGDAANKAKMGKATLPSKSPSEISLMPSAVCWPYKGGWTAPSKDASMSHAMPTSRNGYASCKTKPLPNPLISAGSARPRFSMLGLKLSPPALASVVAALLAAIAVHGA